MECLMNDPELQPMFQNEDIQTEMHTNMKKMHQNKNYREKNKKTKLLFSSKHDNNDDNDDNDVNDVNEATTSKGIRNS